MPTWEEAIIECVEYLGGTATNEDIYINIDKFKSLSPKHLETSIHQGREKYKNQLRSHFSNLRQKGDLEYISSGTFRITEQGKRRIGKSY